MLNPPPRLLPGHTVKVIHQWELIGQLEEVCTYTILRFDRTATTICKISSGRRIGTERIFGFARDALNVVAAQWVIVLDVDSHHR